MRTKVASFFIFFQELSSKKKIKALRPKMTKIASRGGPALNLFKTKLFFLWTPKKQIRGFLRTYGVFPENLGEIERETDL